MRANFRAAALLAASLSHLVPVLGQFHALAKKAGLEYFGTATDSPGQRERAGYESAYVTYDALFRDPKQFGQTTPTNGMKWLFTEPSPGVFNFTEGEIVASLAKEND